MPSCEEPRCRFMTAKVTRAINRETTRAARTRAVLRRVRGPAPVSGLGRGASSAEASCKQGTSYRSRSAGCWGRQKTSPVELGGAQARCAQLRLESQPIVHLAAKEPEVIATDVKRQEEEGRAAEPGGPSRPITRRNFIVWYLA